MDFDADKIRVAQATARANPRVTFERRDFLEVAEYPACDCVLLCDVLHYFPRELKAEMLRKVFQALRPGGRLIVRDACAEETSRPWPRGLVGEMGGALRPEQNPARAAF